MSDKMSLTQLAVAVYNKKVPTQFSTEFTVEDMQETLRQKLRELVPDYNAYRRNKLDLFELIQTVVDEVLPNRIKERIGMFAEIRNVAQGDLPRFLVKK